MKKVWLLIICIALILGIGCSTVKTTDALNFVLSSGHYELRSAAYGEHPRQNLSIYLPKKASDKAPIIFVYGGAWREGERDDYKFVAHAFTELGHPVLIPDYRLYPEVQFPAFINDVASAIRYVEVNAERLLGKPLQPYVLMGHSAGAHTAALLATDRRYLRNAEVVQKPAALVALAGPYELPLDDPEVRSVFADVTVQTAQPVKQVHAGMAPVLLLHGEADKRVYPYHSRNFDTALRQAGVTVKTLIYPDVDHVRIVGGIAAPLRFLNDSYADIKAFLAVHLGTM